MEQECRKHSDRTPLLETDSTSTMEPRAITLDIELYQSFLDNSDLNEDEREAYLEAIWQVIVGFIDFGLVVKPAQKSCGKSSAASTRGHDPDAALLDSIKHAFNKSQKEEAGS